MIGMDCEWASGYSVLPEPPDDDDDDALRSHIFFRFYL